MGAGSSVRTSEPSGTSAEDCCHRSAKEFDSSYLRELASQYHRRLRRDRNSLEDTSLFNNNSPSVLLGAAAPPRRSQSLTPLLPRGQYHRLSRLQENACDGDARHDNQARVKAGMLPAGRRSPKQLSELGRIGLQETGRADKVEDTVPELFGRSGSEFVQRDEMIGLARDLGYGLSPIQGEKIFDMLDIYGAGRIAKEDLIEHFLPLLQTTKATELAVREPLGRGRLYTVKKSSEAPGRPPPASPSPTIKTSRSPSITPLRPVGDPPPTAKRRVTSPTHRRRAEVSEITLNPIKYVDLTARPANFWFAGRSEAIKTVAGSNGAPSDAGAALGRVDGVHRPATLQTITRVCDSVERGEVQSVGSGGEGAGFRSRVHACEIATENRSGEGSIQQMATGARYGRSNVGGDRNNEDQDTVGTCPSVSPSSGGGTRVESGERIDGRGVIGEKRCSLSSKNNDDKLISAEPNPLQPIVTYPRGLEQRRFSDSLVIPEAVPSPVNPLTDKSTSDWTAADVRAWLAMLPRGLAAFAGAQAFLDGTVDGKRLATLRLTDLKRKEFHHSGFRAKVPTDLWKEIKQIRAPPSAALAVEATSRFSAGEDIMDEAFRTPICSVRRFIGRGEFGEMYEVEWTGVGTDRGTTMAMKTVRLADTNTEKRDECRILLIKEILTALRVKPHSSVVNVRHAHIMGFCSEGEEYLCFQDFVTGRNLENVIAEGKGDLYSGTDVEIQGRLLSYSIQLARGLGHIHRCGVLHQDIKSSNVMVDDDERLLITDFGFAAVGHFGPPSVVDRRCATGESLEKGLDRGKYHQRNGAGEERDVGGGWGVPSQGCVLFGTLKGYTPRYQSPEISAITREKARVSSKPSSTYCQDTAHTPSAGTHEGTRTPYTHLSDVWAAGVLILEMYAGTLTALKGGLGENAPGLLDILAQSQETSTGAGRDHFRVKMPEEILQLLREIFERDTRKRPPSMEIVATCLSRALRRMVAEGLALVPRPTRASPSPPSLCEEKTTCDAYGENHGKLGRLHMWLGKAMYLRGGGYRDQALQEYREGVRVLEQSEADRESPSMALFRCYLGKALLDTGQIEEALTHLAKAVALDPDSAKYRYALGAAKRAAGNEAGACEDLAVAALLDEENAKERYQLRVRRQRTETFSVSDTDAPDGNVSRPNDSATAPREVLSLAAVASGQTGKRTDRAVVSDGLDDNRTRWGRWRGGESDPWNAVGTLYNNKSVRYGETLDIPQIRHFSIGDKFVCRRDLRARSPRPFACYPSSRDGVGSRDEDCETFEIEGILPQGQASLDFVGEAYAATAGSPRRTHGGNHASSSKFFHVVHIRFECDAKPSTAPTSPASSAGIAQAPRTAGGQGNSANQTTTKHQHATVTGSRPSNKPSWRNCAGATFLRDADYIPTLKAIGRAAMVGSHTGLAGAILDFTWGPNELTLVAAGLPSGCLTLREALSGSLYRVNGVGKGKKVAEPGEGVEVVVVDRILTIAKQTAAAILHCHHRGVLLQDITPDTILVTLRWEAILRPNYAHAREGPCWADAPAREQREVKAVAGNKTRQQRHGSRLPQGLPEGEPLVASFSDATSQDYQSPEIAKMRRENQPSVRLSKRAPRRSGRSQPPETTINRSEDSSMPPPSCPANDGGGRWRKQQLGENASSAGRGGKRTASESARRSDNDSCSIVNQDTAASSDSWRGAAARACARRRDLDGNAGKGGSTTLPYLGAGEGGSDQNAPLLRDTSGSSDRVPTLTPCTSDVWAWALVVLRMFTDEPWPPDSGQDGLIALEQLLARRCGVESWDTEDVVSWLQAIGLCSASIEREVRTFKIAGPQLLVPVGRRDVVERLGLFIADGESSRRMWEGIASGLQRWTVPPRVAEILRRCLAIDPRDRFPSMEEVCKLLGQVTVGGGSEAHPAAPVTSDRTRRAMILNNIGVCMFGKINNVEEAETYYKMSLEAWREVPEPHFNLGLIYMSPSFDKFRRAQQAFESAAKLMSVNDPRRKTCVEQAKVAERKSFYHQSQETMGALSGKFSSNVSVSPKDSRGAGRPE